MQKKFVFYDVVPLKSRNSPLYDVNIHTYYECRINWGHFGRGLL